MKLSWMTVVLFWMKIRTMISAHSTGWVMLIQFFVGFQVRNSHSECTVKALELHRRESSPGDSSHTWDPRVKGSVIPTFIKVKFQLRIGYFQCKGHNQSFQNHLCCQLNTMIKSKCTWIKIKITKWMSNPYINKQVSKPTTHEKNVKIIVNVKKFRLKISLA